MRMTRHGTVLRTASAAGGATVGALGSIAAAWLATTAAAIDIQLWRPDTLVATAIVWIGAGVALWYAMTGFAVLASAVTRLDLGVARWGAPVVRRLGAGLALALTTVAPATLATPALADSADDLSWSAVAELNLPTRTAQLAVKPSAATAGLEPESAPVYVVAAGDCLWSIAQQESPSADAAWVAHRVAEYVHANPALAANPNLIHPGQELVVPQEEL